MMNDEKEFYREAIFNLVNKIESVKVLRYIFGYLNYRIAKESKEG